MVHPLLKNLVARSLHFPFSGINGQGSKFALQQLLYLILSSTLLPPPLPLLRDWDVVITVPKGKKCLNIYHTTMADLPRVSQLLGYS